MLSFYGASLFNDRLFKKYLVKIEFYSRPRFGLQSIDPIASLSKYPAKAISITASIGKFISIDGRAPQWS